MKNNIHKQIKEILDRGEIVHSIAAGRVGQIMSVGEHDATDFVVVICPYSRLWGRSKRHRHTHGVTTFLSGDSVKLEPWKKDKGIWVVVNADTKSS